MSNPNLLERSRHDVKRALEQYQASRRKSEISMYFVKRLKNMFNVYYHWWYYIIFNM